MFILPSKTDPWLRASQTFMQNMTRLAQEKQQEEQHELQKALLNFKIKTEKGKLQQEEDFKEAIRDAFQTSREEVLQSEAGISQEPRTGKPVPPPNIPLEQGELPINWQQAFRAKILPIMMEHYPTQALGMFPKIEEDYTLGPGQTRFRGREKIGEIAPKPEEEDYTLGPGQTRFRGREKIGEIAPKPEEEDYTLGPGQVRFKGKQRLGEVSPLEKKETKEEKTEATRDELEQFLNYYQKNFPLTVREAESMIPLPTLRRAEMLGIIGKDYTKGTYQYASTQKEAQPIFNQPGIVEVEGKKYILGIDVRTMKPKMTEIPGGGEIAPKATPTIPDEAIKAIQGWDNLEVTAISAQEKWQPYFTGPLQGRLKMWLQGIKSEPEFMRFKTRMKRLVETVYTLSGKAITEQERKWLDNDILPKIENPDKNFMVVMDEFIKWTQQKRDSLVEGYKKGGYRMGGFEALPSSEVPPGMEMYLK